MGLSAFTVGKKLKCETLERLEQYMTGISTPKENHTMKMSTAGQASIESRGYQMNKSRFRMLRAASEPHCTQQHSG